MFPIGFLNASKEFVRFSSEVIFVSRAVKFSWLQKYLLEEIHPIKSGPFRIAILFPKSFSELKNENMRVEIKAEIIGSFEIED